MSNRPDLELALDVRSDEHVVVVTNPESEYDYPETWSRPLTFADLGRSLTASSVVVIDRVEITPKTLELISSFHPRIVAFATQPKVLEYEKNVRRMVTALFPWSEVWTVSTSFGKLLVSKDVRGEAYDRESLLDERPTVSA